MSAQAVLNAGLLPESMVNALKESVAAADAVLTNAGLVNTNSTKTVTSAPQLKLASAPQPNLVVAPTANAATQIAFGIAPWAPSAPSVSRKGTMLALVVLAHALFVLALSMMHTKVVPVEVKPLQVALIAAPESEEDLPPPPQMIPQPVLTLPIEPVLIEIEQPETAITVQARPTEVVTTVASAPTGAPKTVSSVEYIREPQAKYPAAARALKQRGTVTLRVLVDAQGHAREVNLHRSSGFRVLDEAARKAVMDAQFKPYMENGQPQPVYVFVPIEFGAA